MIVIEGTDGSFCAGADMGEALAAAEGGDRRFNPSRDAAATPETHAEIRALLARQLEAVPA